MRVESLPPELQSEVYRPEIDGPVKDFQVNFEPPPDMGEEESSEITVNVGENGDE